MWHTRSDSKRGDSWPKIRNATLLALTIMILAIVVDLFSVIKAGLGTLAGARLFTTELGIAIVAHEAPCLIYLPATLDC